MNHNFSAKDDLRHRINLIRPWRAQARRAANKPLLVLLAISNVQNGLPRLLKFEDIESTLGKALRIFGETRRQVHPEYPFWHLRSDQIWEVPTEDQVLT